MDEADKSGNVEEYIELKEREIGLERARDLTLEQRELEETVDAQEQDLTRLERFKKWAKENVVGLSAITVTSLIITIVVGMRKALVKRWSSCR